MLVSPLHPHDPFHQPAIHPHCHIRLFARAREDFRMRHGSTYSRGWNHSRDETSGNSEAGVWDSAVVGSPGATGARSPALGCLAPDGRDTSPGRR